MGQGKGTQQQHQQQYKQQQQSHQQYQQQAQWQLQHQQSKVRPPFPGKGQGNQAYQPQGTPVKGTGKEGKSKTKIPGVRPPQPRNQVCFNWRNKGYCNRENCPFQHI